MDYRERLKDKKRIVIKIFFPDSFGDRKTEPSQTGSAGKRAQ